MNYIFSHAWVQRQAKNFGINLNAIRSHRNGQRKETAPQKESTQTPNLQRSFSQNYNRQVSQTNSSNQMRNISDGKNKDTQKSPYEKEKSNGYNNYPSKAAPEPRNGDNFKVNMEQEYNRIKRMNSNKSPMPPKGPQPQSEQNIRRPPTGNFGGSKTPNNYKQEPARRKKDNNNRIV